MKNKKLVITIIIFFLTVNTSYFWQGKLSIFAFPVFFILFLIYLILSFKLIQQLYFAFRESFKYKNRTLIICLLTTVLISTYLKPFGIVNFEKFESPDILIAEREGVANCMMTLKLKENNEFSAKSVCFGMTETNGEYHLKKDTIFFENIKIGRGDNEFYQFATLNFLNKKNSHLELRCFKNKKDSIGHQLRIKLNKTKLKPF